METLSLYISPDGNDKLDGGSPENKGASGPMASLQAAFDRLASLKRQSVMPDDVKIFVRGGTYTLTKPIVLKPAHSFV
ncbi:MAG: hypothetical protein WD708_07575 [Kiritimatiellia bacterium]